MIKERIYWRKGIGILVGLIGAVLLILYGSEIRQDAPNIPVGNMLFLINAIFFGLYLIFAKKLIEKYHPFTLMKWLFLVGFLINLPIGYQEFMDVLWTDLPLPVVATMVFVVIGTTCCTYLFNVFALTQLKASTVSSFIYLQPLFGILFAILIGVDQLSPVKIGAAFLVLLGVYLVSKLPKTKS